MAGRRSIVSLVGLLLVLASATGAQDTRNIHTGWEIPTEAYADQPYIVKTDDGAWLCILTTGSGQEGAKGQHVVSLRSIDQGRTWSKPVDVEPANGPEASTGRARPSMSSCTATWSTPRADCTDCQAAMT